MNRWYDDVDSNASPDDVFWEEMERQRLMNQLPDTPSVTPMSAPSTNNPNSNIYDAAPAAGTGNSMSDIAMGLDALSAGGEAILLLLLVVLL